MTAPEISQMFGELIGCGPRRCGGDGRAGALHLVELGPGRGTLMADALRAARGCRISRRRSRCIWSRSSPVAARRQQATLADATAGPGTRASRTCRTGPAIMLANEFLDALPVDQFVKTGDGWHQRMVGLDATAASPSSVMPDPTAPLPSPVRRAGRRDLRMAPDAPVAAAGTPHRADGGAALIIDYGHVQTRIGERCRPCAAQVRRSARRSRRGRPHRACRFRRARRARPRGARARTARSTRANSCAGSASRSAPRAEGERDAAAGRRIDAALRAPHRARNRWASCSRCWPSPIRSSARCRDLTLTDAKQRTTHGPDTLFTASPYLSFPHIPHAFFTREGGVSDGIYAILNGGVGSSDAPENAENRSAWRRRSASRRPTRHLLPGPFARRGRRRAPWTGGDRRAPTRW